MKTILITLMIFYLASPVMADINDPCPNPTAANYKQCKDCQCKIFRTIPGNRITQLTSQWLFELWIKDSYTHEADLNEDGKVNMIDMIIAKKCIGCTNYSCPSPPLVPGCFP